MSINGPRWTRACVSTSATALFAVSGSVTAFATQTHTFQHGDTLSSIARAYHVSVADIKKANGLQRDDNIRDGKRLTIPDPPRKLTLPPSLRQSTHAKGDRISLRLGPGADYRRVGFIDNGAPLTVTAQRDEWFQVELDNGKTGWLRQDFVAHALHPVTEHRGAAPERRIAGGEAPHTAKHSATVSHPAADKHHQVARATTPHHADRRHQVARATTSVTPTTVTPHPAGKHHAGKRMEVASTEPHRAHGAERGEGRHRRLHPDELASNHSHARHDTSHAHHVLAATRHHGEHAVARHTHHHGRAQQVALRSGRSGSDIVRSAIAYRGTPYVYGGAGRGGFDCSGFTSYLYGRKGVSLPHSARGQFQMGHRVGRGELKPGDLVFFHTVTPGISHVGMYVGNGHFVHASSRRSGGVRVDNLDSGYYRSAFRGARRMR